MSRATCRTSSSTTGRTCGFCCRRCPLVVIMLVAAIDAICRRARCRSRRRARASWRPSVTCWRCCGCVEAQDRQAFRLQALEARFERAGTFVDRRLPPNALVITSWQSGSVRFYSGRKTLVWDQLDPAWLDGAIAFVRSRGLRAVPAVREVGRAAVPPAVCGAERGRRLDWPPAAEVASQVRVYRPGDRDRYLRGVQPPTEYFR